MDLYPIGQPIRLSTTVKTVAGVLTDPGALVLTYVNTAPDSTPVTKNWPTPADITKDSTGTFHYDVPAGLTAGHYRYTWVSTGTAAGERADVFDVFDPADYPRLVSLADTIAFLANAGYQSSPAKDALLDRYIGWASARILREVQAVQVTVTDRVGVDSDGFVLPTTPVAAVTSLTAVTPHAPTLTAADVYVSNKLGGVVNMVTATTGGVYDVTYTAGQTEIPRGADGACLALIRHWWNQAQAHGSTTYGDAGFIPDFKGLPNLVLNQLAASPRVSGVA